MRNRSIVRHSEEIAHSQSSYVRGEEGEGEGEGLRLVIIELTRADKLNKDWTRKRNSVAPGKIGHNRPGQRTTSSQTRQGALKAVSESGRE